MKKLNYPYTTKEQFAFLDKAHPENKTGQAQLYRRFANLLEELEKQNPQVCLFPFAGDRQELHHFEEKIEYFQSCPNFKKLEELLDKTENLLDFQENIKILLQRKIEISKTQRKEDYNYLNYLATILLAFKSKQQYLQALQLIERSLQLCQNQPKKQELNADLLFILIENPENSVSILQDVLKMYQNLMYENQHDQKFILRLLYKIGLVHLQLQKYEQALKTFQNYKGSATLRTKKLQDCYYYIYLTKNKIDSQFLESYEKETQRKVSYQSKNLYFQQCKMFLELKDIFKSAKLLELAAKNLRDLQQDPLKNSDFLKLNIFLIQSITETYNFSKSWDILLNLNLIKKLPFQVFKILEKRYKLDDPYSFVYHFGKLPTGQIGQIKNQKLSHYVNIKKGLIEVLEKEDYKKAEEILEVLYKQKDYEKDNYLIFTKYMLENGKKRELFEYFQKDYFKMGCVYCLKKKSYQAFFSVIYQKIDDFENFTEEVRMLGAENYVAQIVIEVLNEIIDGSQQQKQKAGNYLKEIIINFYSNYQIKYQFEDILPWVDFINPMQLEKLKVFIENSKKLSQQQKSCVDKAVKQTLLIKNQGIFNLYQKEVVKDLFSFQNIIQ